VNKPWGSLHTYDIKHVLGGVFPQLNYKPVVAPSSWFTVNVAPDFHVSHGPGVRFIVDFKEGVYMMLPGAQMAIP